MQKFTLRTFFGLPGVLFGSELAKTTESCVKFLRERLTFAGTRVDQSVAIEVLEALRPQGVQAALDALDQSQNQTDEKRTSLELALQKARYEASRIERQYQATEPEKRLVATELEKRWNNALTHVAEL